MSKVDSFRDRPIPEPDGVKKSGMALKKVKEEYPDLEFANATVGVFHETNLNSQPDWYIEAGRLADESVFEERGKKTGYNFLVNPKFLESQARLIFGDKVDMHKIEVAPSYGGSDAIKTINGIAQGIVPCLVPTWANHKGLIETNGGIMIPYRAIDEQGNFDAETLKQMLNPEEVIRQTRNEIALRAFLSKFNVPASGTEKYTYQTIANDWVEGKEVMPLLEAICKNPYSIDIPKDLWPTVAELLKKNDMIVQMDLAYLGFAQGACEDLKFVRYLANEGVKMIVEASMSKFHSHYGWERVGSIMAVNFDPKEHGIKGKLLHQIRNTTSAIAERGQVMSTIIEEDPNIREAQRTTVKHLRENSDNNRAIIASALPKAARRFASKDAKGPFLFAPDGKNGPLLPYVFPELAEQLGVSVPENAKNFPNDKIRVAGVYSSAEDGLGLGGLRLGIAGISEATATDVRNTLEYAYEQLNR